MNDHSRQQVLTSAGLVNLNELEVTDLIEIGDNYRKVVSEFRHGGELVKRDVTISALRPLTAQAQEGSLG